MRPDLLAHGWLWAFTSVFLGGVLTSLTPCVYPLISITVSLFGARDENVTRGRAMALASLYVAGIGLMYASLGIFSALAGHMFGTHMASPVVMLPIAVLLIIMAASMFGAFELSLPHSLQARLTGVGGKGFAGAFAMGMVGGIIAAPCTGPVLASVLAFVATTRSVLIGGSLLFTYALGMGVLFFAIAAFAVSLPKSGRWMEAVKSILAVPMVVAAMYFLRNVSPALAHWGRRDLWWIAVQVGMVIAGVLLGGIHLSFHDPAARLRKALGVTAIIAGLYGVVSSQLLPKSAIVDGAKVELSWIAGEKAGVAAARAAHRPAVIDFYADWCLPCKEMEIKTFSKPEIAREFGRFTLIKMNCSSSDDPVVAETQSRYGADTLPTLVLIGSDGKVAQTLHDFVTADELLPLLKKVQ
jgi:thiol:disulfide interchange protein DsbD